MITRLWLDLGLVSHRARSQKLQNAERRMSLRSSAQPDLAADMPRSVIGRADRAREFLANAIRRRPRILGALAVAAASVVLIGAASSELAPPIGCRAEPVALAAGVDADATMTLRGGMACSLWVKTSTASIEQLDIIAPPSHGVVIARGRTGVIYRPARQFTGEDSFVFTLRAKSARFDRTSVVRVGVTVQ